MCDGEGEGEYEVRAGIGRGTGESWSSSLVGVVLWSAMNRGSAFGWKV